MVPILIALGVFIVGAIIVFAVSTGVARIPGMMVERRVQARIDDVMRLAQPETNQAFELVKRQAEGGGLERLVANTSAGSWLRRLIDQAGAKTSVGTILMSAIGLGVVVGLGATLLLGNGFGIVPGFLLGASVPFIALLRKKSVRIKKFEEQFPEALDLLSRAIKAGHAFQTAMGMVAEEGAEPMGPEFKKTFEEQNYGLPLKDALNNLAARMPLLDVRFFVTAVLIQRETGGNLSEILDNLAYVVRERFKILRQVRVYTAHGRMTGYVLLGLPAFLAVALMFINPDHMNTLFTTKPGNFMIAATVVMQAIGFFWIRNIVKIEV
jgi:tight adherence protein B